MFKHWSQLFSWLMKRQSIQDESLGAEYFSNIIYNIIISYNYETPPRQIHPTQYTVYSVSSDIMLSCAMVCFHRLCAASQVSPWYTKGLTENTSCWEGLTWDARQIIVIITSSDFCINQSLHNHAHTSHINGSTRAQLTHSHFLFPLEEVKKSLQNKTLLKYKSSVGSPQDSSHTVKVFICYTKLTTARLVIHGCCSLLWIMGKY